MTTTSLRKSVSPPPEDTPNPVNLGIVVASGIAFFYLAMCLYAILVFQQFHPAQVVGAALAFGVVFLCLVALFLSQEILRLTFLFNWRSLFMGMVLALALFVMAFTWLTMVNGPVWSQYFPLFPMTQLSQGNGFHQDAVFHLSLIQSILNFGYPSTGQNGTPFVPYHVLSHYLDALLLRLTGLEPFDSYGLFFHFKVALFVSGIVVFLWMITQKMGNRAFWIALVVLTPVFLSTWIGIGSHGLWLTSLVLLLSSKYVFDALAADRASVQKYLVIFGIGAALGLGKVSSGLMFAVLVGTVLLIRDWRRPHPYALGLCWAVFFGLYWSIFKSGHSSGLSLPSLSGLVRFLNYKTTYTPGPPEPNLAGLYLLLLLLALSGWVFRSRLTTRLLVASTVSILAVAAITQMLAGLAQPDIFYFIFGLFMPAALLGVQSLLTDLPKKPHLPTFMRTVTPRTTRIGLLVLMILCTQPLEKPPINIFNPGIAPVKDSLVAANRGYFSQYNAERAPDEQATVKRIVLEGFQLSFSEPESTSPTRFRNALNDFMDQEALTRTNSLLFVPEEIYASSLAALGGPSWARGMLVYSLTGVPVIHGIEDETIKTFGQNSYDSSAMQLESADLDTESACSSGKQIIEIRSWDRADFETVCPAD